MKSTEHSKEGYRAPVYAGSSVFLQMQLEALVFLLFTEPYCSEK